MIQRASHDFFIRVVYVPAMIGQSNGLPLAKLMQMANSSRIDILKMDIEGGEFDVIRELTNNGTRLQFKTCMILMELHGGFIEKYGGFP